MTEQLRDEQIELRERERELVQQVEDAQRELSHIRARLAHIKNLLVQAGRARTRVPASGPRSARRMLARMETFTVAEAMSRLGWNRQQVDGLFKLMLSEVPPALARGSRHGGYGVKYSYTGPEIDPEGEGQDRALDAVHAWLSDVAPGVRVTPGSAAVGAGISRAHAQEALQRLAKTDMLTDLSPSADRPMFERAGTGQPMIVPELPPAQEAKAPASKIPSIQAMLDAANAADFGVTESTKHFAIEAPGGDRLIISTKYEGREKELKDRAWLRSHGADI